MTILVTGTAGFIGFHVTNRLLKDGHEVIGIDNLNTYYDVTLKHSRLAQVGINSSVVQYNTSFAGVVGYTFYQLQLEDKNVLTHLFQQHKPDVVIHLAAQAGVRYSIINPDAYISVIL